MGTHCIFGQLNLMAHKNLQHEYNHRYCKQLFAVIENGSRNGSPHCFIVDYYTYIESSRKFIVNPNRQVYVFV